MQINCRPEGRGDVGGRGDEAGHAVDDVGPGPALHVVPLLPVLDHAVLAAAYGRHAPHAVVLGRGGALQAGRGHRLDLLQPGDKRDEGVASSVPGERGDGVQVQPRLVELLHPTRHPGRGVLHAVPDLPFDGGVGDEPQAADDEVGCGAGLEGLHLLLQPSWPSWLVCTPVCKEGPYSSDSVVGHE